MNCILELHCQNEKITQIDFNILSPQDFGFPTLYYTKKMWASQFHLEEATNVYKFHVADHADDENHSQLLKQKNEEIH